MRCPKCGYISFDYNQVCPKCNKDITGERAKMNLPSFRPTPPSLLGALTGEANESSVNLGVSVPTEPEMIEQELDVSLDDSGEISVDDIAFDEGQDLDINLEAKASIEFEAPEEALASDDISESGEGDAEISLDESLSDFEFEPDNMEISLEPEVMVPEDTESTLSLPGAKDDGISMDLEGMPEGGPEAEQEDSSDSDQKGDELLLDLGDLSLDDSEDAGDLEIEEPETGMDLDAFLHEGEDTSGKTDITVDESEKDEIEIDLKDLKINDTGELEIADSDEFSRGEEQGMELGDITLDTPISDLKIQDKEESLHTSGTMALDSAAISESIETEDVAEEDGLSLDLEDLDLELDLDESIDSPK